MARSRASTRRARRPSSLSLRSFSSSCAVVRATTGPLLGHPRPLIGREKRTHKYLTGRLRENQTCTVRVLNVQTLRQLGYNASWEPLGNVERNRYGDQKTAGGCEEEARIKRAPPPVSDVYAQTLDLVPTTLCLELLVHGVCVTLRTLLSSDLYHNELAVFRVTRRICRCPQSNYLYVSLSRFCERYEHGL